MAQFGEVRVDFITYTTGVAPSEGSVTTSVSGVLTLPVLQSGVYTTGAFQVPAGTTSERPSPASTGMFRYNTEFTRFEGYSEGDWSEIGGGATGSGGDQVFVLNDQQVTTSYTFPSGKNGMSAGTITIETGVTVVLGSGQNWVIV